MLYLPFENYEIESSLSPKEVKERLAADIETKMPFFSLFYEGGKKFKGKINKAHFLITRIIQSQNSFLPLIEGAIFPATVGSKIKITMRLNKWVLGFWIFWMTMVSLFGIGLLPMALINLKFEYLIPVFMLIFGYFLCMIPFNIEVNEAKGLLNDILHR